MTCGGTDGSRAARFILASAFAIGGVSSLAMAGVQGQSRPLAEWLQVGPGVINHPIGVIPSAAIHVPMDWPLDADGSITCRTCHNELPSLENGDRRQLRGSQEGEPEVTAFCARCHAEGTEGTAATMHWMAMRVAHIKAGDNRSDRQSGTLDRESQRCLGCHDGVTADDARNSTAVSRTIGHMGDVRRNHPIGIQYPYGRSPNRGTVFRPASLLPPQVRLPDNTVSCVSCHNLYARSHNLLSVPIDNSALCFTCHDI
ncbi:MAG: hypothetical protein JSU86_05355 [Phycisphaerales bacterium]|nr:MAG: hypothetical protein JSU86_05355 [Phycisphaerales bacterium]